MRHVEPAQNRVARGFTLLEIMLAMFVFAMLVGSIFAIVSGTTQLADEMARAHERDSQTHSFAQLCERTLRRLPPQAQVRLKVKQSGKHYLSRLAMFNAPSVLGAGWGRGNGLTIIETDQHADGYLRVSLRFVSAEQVGEYESGSGKTGQVLVLLNDVARCEWRFFNPASNEWEPVWNESLVFASPRQQILQPTLPPTSGRPMSDLSQRPILVELTLAMRSEPTRRFVFWVPPAKVPDGLVGGPR